MPVLKFHRAGRWKQRWKAWERKDKLELMRIHWTCWFLLPQSWWLGPAEAGILVMELSTHQAQESEQLWRFHGKFQSCLLPHANETSQQIKDNMYQLPNGCYFISTHQILHEKISCVLPYLETYRGRNSGKCSPAEPSDILTKLPWFRFVILWSNSFQTYTRRKNSSFLGLLSFSGVLSM